MAATRNPTDFGDEVADDEDQIETPVMLHEDDEEYPDNGTYLVGNIAGSDEYTGSNFGLEESGRELREKLENIDDPDVLQIEEAEGMPGLFQMLYDAVDDHPNLNKANKDVLTGILRNMEVQVSRGSKANEEMLISDVRQIGHIAPDIVEIMLPGMQGFAEEVSGPLRRVIQRLKQADTFEEREL